VHAKNKPFDDTVDFGALAQRTPGFTGADLENLLNEAALVAARSNKRKIDMRDVDEATDRVIAGPEKKSRVISEKERNIVAFHEAGHTVIGMVLDDADMVHKVTIVPRGQAGGRSEERRVGKECRWRWGAYQGRKRRRGARRRRRGRGGIREGHDGSCAERQRA